MDLFPLRFFYIISYFMLFFPLLVYFIQAKQLNCNDETHKLFEVTLHFSLFVVWKITFRIRRKLTHFFCHAFTIAHCERYEKD